MGLLEWGVLCRNAVEAFMKNPFKVAAFDDHLRGITDGFTEVAFTGSVRKDMDAMFRRTGDILLNSSRLSRICHAKLMCWNSSHCICRYACRFRLICHSVDLCLHRYATQTGDGCVC